MSVAFAPASVRLPWPRFQSPAHQTGRADFPHPAFRRDHASACGTVWSFRTLCGPDRLSPVAMPCPLSVPFPKSGPFPRPALPGVLSRTGLSATLPARTGPRGFPVGVHPPPTGLPVLLRFPSSMHADATTPAKRTGASAACFPDRHRSSPNLRRVDSRIALFEACSAFTRVPACMVAEPPEAALLHQSASVYIVTSVNRSGCCQPKRQLLSGFRTRKENAPFHGALREIGYWLPSIG